MPDSAAPSPKHALFGPRQGWSLEPVADWLLTEGRHIQNAVALIAELTRHLDAAGANIDRVRLTTTSMGTDSSGVEAVSYAFEPA